MPTWSVRDIASVGLTDAGARISLQASVCRTDAVNWIMRKCFGLGDRRALEKIILLHWQMQSMLVGF